MSKLDEFTLAYIDCALWSSTGEDGGPLDDKYGRCDIAPETFAIMVCDCEKFQADNEVDLTMAEYKGVPCNNADVAGHDFWLTRNHHGSGFWDGELEEKLGERLTKAAQLFGSFDLYVGDDDLIYSMQ